VFGVNKWTVLKKKWGAPKTVELKKWGAPEKPS